jgi:uracil-DNA glycosylase
MLTIADSWKKVLHSEMQKTYFFDLIQKVDFEYANYTCFPPKDLIFEAFNLCSFDDLKVVIIGQDPYHGEGEANGLCFSVNESIAMPPSLRNILTEIENDLGNCNQEKNLNRWAKQGVLLLNSTLTVQKDKANSHKNLGWKAFTDAIISIINKEKSGIVFLLWGNFAKEKGKKIDRAKHLVLESGHPSPLSANKKLWFLNKKQFSTTNLYLKENGLSEIDW